MLVFNKISLLQFYRSSCRPGTLLGLFSLTSVRHGLRRHFYVCFSSKSSTGGWISFRFCATDLGSEKLTSVKKPSSVRVFTVGKLSSVGVQVTSSVLTEPGLRKPTSFCKPYRGCRYLTSVWCYYITVHGNTEYRNRVRFCF